MIKQDLRRNGLYTLHCIANYGMKELWFEITKHYMKHRVPRKKYKMYVNFSIF